MFLVVTLVVVINRQTTSTHTIMPLYCSLFLSGEEGEKKIVQVPGRLYAFDLNTHTWKERGRGEIRLNDAAQSEGLFQSRLGKSESVVCA